MPDTNDRDVRELAAAVKAWFEDISAKSGETGILMRGRDSHAGVFASGVHAWNIYDLACAVVGEKDGQAAEDECWLDALREAAGWHDDDVPVEIELTPTQARRILARLRGPSETSVSK